MNAAALSRSERTTLLVAVLLLLAVRLPFLPPALEDIDSINFDLGVHDFDPLAHQPHPPGYILFIAAAKLTHPFFASHAAGLAFVSAVFSAALVIPLLVLMRSLVGATAGWLATLFVLFTPLVWFNGVRPMSDSMGLFAVVSTMALLVGALERREDDEAAADRLWKLGALAAGLSLGIRVQALMLVGPLLAYGWFRQRRLRTTTVSHFGFGVLLWLIPLLALCGGPGPLWRVFVRLVQDAAPVEPLLNTFTLHRAAWAVHDSFFAPWGPLWFSIPVVAWAVVGFGILAWSERSRLLLLALLFLPYAAYHFLLQWTDTLRYAMPIVPATAALAAVPFVRWRKGLGVPLGVVGLVYVGVSAAVTGPALRHYGSTPSPAAQAIERLAELGSVKEHAPIVGGHFMFFRHLPWLPSNVKVIRPVPRVEWRQLAEYWRDGGRRPMYFLRDAVRTSLVLIDPESQREVEHWGWPEPVDRLVKGSRPTDIGLVRIEPPRWFAFSGFLITYEAGPVAVVEREPHRLYVRREPFDRRLMVSGEVPGGGTADITAAVSGTDVDRWTVSGHFTLDLRLDASEPVGDYAHVTFTSATPLHLRDVWLESSSGASVRPGNGFYMPERDEDNRLFRWMGPDATALVLLPPNAVGARLRLRGQIPIEYYQLPVTLSFVVDGTTVAAQEVGQKQFEVEQTVPIAGPEGRVRLLTSQHFVPDDREKSGDRRQLAVRVYELTAEPAAADGAP